MFKIVENVFPEDVKKQLNEFALSDTFSWLFSRYSASDTLMPYIDYEKSKFQFSWAHPAIQDGEDYSPMSGFIREVVDPIVRKHIGLPVAPIERARFGLHTPTVKSIRNGFHLDSPQPHVSFLYYVNDSDGDTTFIRETDDSAEEFTVTPKENTAAIFTNYFHCSSTPTITNRRVTLNIVYQLLDYPNCLTPRGTTG